MFSFARLPVVSAIALTGLAVLFGAGCGSTSNGYSVSEGRLAQRSLPGERHVDYPPDSLVALTLRETDDQIKFELNTSYESLMARWSSTYRISTAGRQPTRPLTYATFWSLELSLASLQPETGAGSLTKDKAQQLIDERRKEYEDVIQIDVYLFGSPSASAIAGPGTRVRLQDSQNKSYDPISRDYSPVREAFLIGGETGLYRRNTFLFARKVDGRDILDQTNELSLHVSNVRGSFAFQWSWDTPPPTAAVSESDPDE